MQNNVLEYLDDTVKKYPDKLAFVDENTSYSFKEIDEYQQSIGSFIIRSGYRHESIIVYMRKSVQMITAFFGVIASGCFYVPIDEELPEARVKLIHECCEARLIICDEYTIEKARDIFPNVVSVLYSEMIISETDLNMLSRVRSDALDIDPIYIVFTSGSTGSPKGVVACHRSVIDYVEQLSDVLRFSKESVFGNQSPLYFDACLKEIYPTIKFGATTYIVPRQLFMFPVRLIEYLNKNKINTICWVSSALTMISSLGAFETVKPEFIRTVAFGSEVFPVKQLNVWRKALPMASFTNLYGPTECTGMSCYYHVDREFLEDEPIPIGRPFRNTEIILLGENGKPVTDGEVGEIYIRGTCVTHGYYDSISRTNQVFVQNPLNNKYNEIIYRTGDMAYKNDYGELVFVSRRDHQIKHMGHRIELEEIEASVNCQEGVRYCACIYSNDTDRIVLYYFGDIKEADLIEYLKVVLPRYMIPNAVFKTENMLFTQNGKIDRKGFENMYLSYLQQRKK